MVVAKCGQIFVPSSQAATNRSATAPGGGRMYGGRAVTVTTTCQITMNETKAAATGSQTVRLTTRPPAARGTTQSSPASSVRRVGVGEVPPDLRWS